MVIKAILLTILVVSAAIVRADNSLHELPKWDIEVHGGYLMRHQFESPVAAEVINGGTTAVGQRRITASDNYTGGIMVRRSINEKIDFGLGYTGIASSGNDRNFSSTGANVLFLPATLFGAPVGGTTLRASVTTTHHIADAEVGYLIPLSSASAMKVIGGIRFVRFDQNMNVSVPAGSHRRESDFTGAGPKLGLQYFHDLGNKFRIKLGANGSILGGYQRAKLSTTALGATSRNGLAEARVVYNTGAELSLMRNWTENLSTSLGYRASAWFGLRDNLREFDAAATIANGVFVIPGGERRPIDFYHGPFLSLNYRI